MAWEFEICQIVHNIAAHILFFGRGILQQDVKEEEEEKQSRGKNGKEPLFPPKERVSGNIGGE